MSIGARVWGLARVATGPRRGLRAFGQGLAVVLALAVAGPPAGAQEAASMVLTLDQERLYQSTLFGQRLEAELAAARQTLIAKNAEDQRNLEAEEAELTEKRATLPPEEFRALADAFDAKVTGVRAEQERNVRTLQRQIERARQQFFGAVEPLLLEVVRQRGAAVVLDARAVLINTGQLDVTDEVRARVDTLLGDGGSISAVPSQQDQGEEAPADEPTGKEEDSGLDLPLGTPVPD